MKVEAIKRDDGLFIPMQEAFRRIRKGRVLLDVTLVEPGIEPDGAETANPLDELIGLCRTEVGDASTHHDRRIYCRGDGK
jgi:hypothetical protein